MKANVLLIGAAMAAMAGGAERPAFASTRTWPRYCPLPNPSSLGAIFSNARAFKKGQWMSPEKIAPARSQFENRRATSGGFMLYYSRAFGEYSPGDSELPKAVAIAVRKPIPIDKTKRCKAIIGMNVLSP